MKHLVVGSIVLMLITLGWGDRSWGEQVPTPRGELRIVDTRGNAWGDLDWNVFDHLIEVDKGGQLVPGLALRWRWIEERTLELTLRQGVTFHNGEVFDAAIVQLNWQEHIRYKQPNILGAHMNFPPGSRLEILDAHTVRFVFPAPDGGALHKLAHMHIANRQFYQEFGWGEKRW